MEILLCNFAAINCINKPQIKFLQHSGLRAKGYALLVTLYAFNPICWFIIE